MSYDKEPTVYIMASRQNGTLYTGVTSDLYNRVLAHKAGQLAGFTKKYNCKMLVFYSRYETMEEAIKKEKVIKGGSRQAKLKLIEDVNPTWRDLYYDFQII